jgi:hypothetical protein
LDKLLPSRATPTGLARSKKFMQIRSSIKEIGLIEPLSVGAVNRKTGEHLLLDGHMRLLALRELDHHQVHCLVATDDESYTYNNRVSRLSSVQEHYMIQRALKRGVTRERLATVLGLDIRTIERKAALLDGVCPEAVDLLKDCQFTANISSILRKMKPTRQIECAELMVSANTISVAYAQALLAATPISMLLGGELPTKLKGLSPEQMARMEREMSNIQDQYKAVEHTYGQDVLNLVLTKGYLAKLLGNKEVRRYLKLSQPEILTEFESIVQSVSLDH